MSCRNHQARWYFTHFGLIYFASLASRSTEAGQVPKTSSDGKRSERGFALLMEGWVDGALEGRILIIVTISHFSYHVASVERMLIIAASDRCVAAGVQMDGWTLEWLESCRDGRTDSTTRLRLFGRRSTTHFVTLLESRKPNYTFCVPCPRLTRCGTSR